MFEQYIRINYVTNSYFIMMNCEETKTLEYIPNEILNNIDNKIVFISCSFITKVDNLPSNRNIKCLYLIANFNQLIDNLPYGIEELYLGDRFNNPIDFIPLSIKFISLGYEFNQSLDNLPNSLETIELNSQNYSLSLTNIPSTVKTLIKGGQFKRHINDLPDSIEKIIIHNENNWIKQNSDSIIFPKSLKYFVIIHYYGDLDQYEIIKKKCPCILKIKIKSS